MDKGILKIELIVTLIVSYFTTLLVIFCYKPMDILIANIMNQSFGNMKDWALNRLGG